MGRITQNEPWLSISGEGEGSAGGLLEELLSCGARLRVRVTGRSMAPSLQGGEFVFIRREPVKKLSRGDLVLYRDSRGFLVLHRLVGKGKKELRTRGDALGRADGPVAPSRVLGRVCAIQDAEGKRTRNLGSLRLRLAGMALGLLQQMRLFRALHRAIRARFASGQEPPQDQEGIAQGQEKAI